MNLYITQNSYYFVHKHFINFFMEGDSKIVYVRERKRGILKKYIEITFNFGLINTIVCSLLEFFYFLSLSNRAYKLNSLTVNDRDLNIFLDEELQSNKYSQIISIGCPCMIDSKLQNKYDVSIINIHGGIIPFQRGRFSPLRSIKSGHRYLGASIYEISDTFDEGKILSQDFFEIKNKFLLPNYNKVLDLSSNLLNLFLKNNYLKIPENVNAELSKICKDQ